MQNNQSPAPKYEFDESRTYFTVILPAHPDYTQRLALRDAVVRQVTGARPPELATRLAPSVAGPALAMPQHPAPDANLPVLERASAALQANQPQAAHKLFESAKKSLGSYPHYLYEFARCKLEIALAMPESMTSSGPTHELDARNALLREARKLLRTVVQSSASKSTRARAHHELARTLGALGEPESHARAEQEKAEALLKEEANQEH
jgi:hypothetical protein